MNELFEAFSKLWGSKLYRLRLILAAAIAVLAFSVCVMWVSSLLRAPHDNPGALTALKCSKCGNSEDLVVTSVSDASVKCSKCGAPLALRMKCQDCGFEFARKSNDTVDCIKGKSKAESCQILMNQNVCPNCGSNKTGSAPIK